MGASTSTEDNSEGGLTLEGLMEEANRVLARVTEVITQTVESEAANMMGDIQEKAAAKMGSTFAMIQKKLAELSRQNEEAKACVERKQPELQSIKEKMKNAILECYSKHNAALEKLRSDRAIIHTEAEQFKLDVQRITQNCMVAENRLECFNKSLAEVGKKVDALLKKFEGLVKREAEVRATTAKQFVDCEKKAVDAANKDVDRILEEIRKCGENALNK